MNKFISDEEIQDLFGYHAPADGVIKAAHEAVRSECKDIASWLNFVLPESPQKTHLIRQILPEVMMRANQCIAIHGVSAEFRSNVGG